MYYRFTILHVAPLVYHTNVHSRLYQMKGTSILAVLWDYYPCKQDVFVGEVLLDLATADLQDTSHWYPLEKHDENCGRLPVPSPKMTPEGRASGGGVGGVGGDLSAGREGVSGEESSQQQWTSLPVLPATPAHDKVKELLGKRGSQGACTVYI